ncbi:MAG: transcription termination factor Rho [Planctomycetota bacterium]
MTAKDDPHTPPGPGPSRSETLPFGAGALDPPPPRAPEPAPVAVGGGEREAAESGEERGRSRWRGRRGRRGHREERGGEGSTAVSLAPGEGAAGEGATGAPAGDGRPLSARAEKRRRWKERRARRKQRGGPPPDSRLHRDRRPPTAEAGEVREVEGMLVLEKAQHGHLRRRENDFLPARDDVHVSPHLVQKLALREGALLRGPFRKGQGFHRFELLDVTSVDGRDPHEVRNLRAFKLLTSIDPDFHYAVGDGSGEVSLKVVDLICPIGRGQRGLIVAPPRSGKTVLMQQFARAIEKIYPEVHLIVLLVDERPEEATDWRRTLATRDVFVSTNDEAPTKHVELCEAVWRRCRRLVELGEDVVLILDSITRVGRAYNNVHGNSGKTMSGGIDTRALERPKQFFGSARNTETAGSLTILGTTLIETGSRMDQVIFEEFKGTGNMELVLARRLAERRIFPAIDLEKSGTRKDEKLISSGRLRRIVTLRRVLLKMHWAEAMELLIAKLEDVQRTDDFLDRFEIDPEA